MSDGVRPQCEATWSHDPEAGYTTDHTCRLPTGHDGRHWCCNGIGGHRDSKGGAMRVPGNDRSDNGFKWYYGATECALALGVTRQRVSQLHAAGSLPKADVAVGGRFGWDPVKFDAFIVRRNAYRATQPYGPGKVSPDD